MGRTVVMEQVCEVGRGLVMEGLLSEEEGFELKANGDSGGCYCE